jgi:hypothetical protein
MNDFVTKIDALTTAFLDDEYPEATKLLYGYTELVKQKDQPFPVVINGTADRSTVNRISLNDQYDFISWVRLPGRIRTVNSEQDSWGLKEGKKHTAGLRWIVAYKVTLAEDELLIKLIQSLPATFLLTGYTEINISPDFEVDADHEGVYTTELGNTNYEKHRFDWNIYAIELNIDYIYCDIISSP